MSFIIAETCVGVKDASCVTVCPVDCIITTDDQPMYYIDPDECIDCGACVPECPVNAIFNEAESIPNELAVWVEVNRDFCDLDRDAFQSKHGKLIADAKEKNKDSEHALPALYA